MSIWKNRTTLITIPFICALLLAACGRSNASPRGVMEKNLQIMEEFSRDMDKAGSASDVAAALDRYTQSLEALGPQILALQKSHPELARMDQDGSFPAEFKDLEEKFTAAGMQMMGAMMKIMPYMNDPKVQEAQNRMIAAAQKLQ